MKLTTIDHQKSKLAHKFDPPIYYLYPILDYDPYELVNENDKGIST